MSYFSDELLGPIVTGVGVGLALRAALIPREVTRNDARAEEIAADLTRWVHDRNRRLRAEIMRAFNLARQGVIEDVVAVLMGHKRQGTTALYSYLFADAFEGVEEALDAVLGVNEASTERSVSTGHSDAASNRRSDGTRAVAGVSAT